MPQFKKRVNDQSVERPPMASRFIIFQAFSSNEPAHHCTLILQLLKKTMHGGINQLKLKCVTTLPSDANQGYTNCLVNRIMFDIWHHHKIAPTSCTTLTQHQRRSQPHWRIISRILPEHNKQAQQSWWVLERNKVFELTIPSKPEYDQPCAQQITAH
jgi:hypothetical protein